MALRHPQSEGGCNSTLLNVGNIIVGETPRHQELGSPDACAVAREHRQSKGGCNSTLVNVGNDIFNEKPRYQELSPPDARAVVGRSLGDEFELSNSAPNFGN